MKSLIIVESPAKAKTIEKYLGKDYVVRASYGHIFDLGDGGSYNMGIDIENNFTPKYVLMSDKKEKLKAITDAAMGADQIFLASDPDREGEAIAYHIFKALKTKKPIKRVLFKEITKSGVKHGISNPRDIDNNLFEAQQSRRVLDRIVGYQVSPFIIKLFGPHLSAGRVQSVALRLIVDREREIENFKPEEYWSVTVCLKKDSNEFFVAKYEGKINDKEHAEKIKSDLEKDTFKVKSIDEKEKKKYPFPPFVTSTLAATAAGYFKFPVARTMKAAQTLYESGLITYMRTDSTRIAPEALDSCRDWLKGQNFDIPDKPNIYQNKDAAQDAHEAIRPTDIEKLPDQVFGTDDEKKIYKLIWQRFAASQMKPAIYDTATVTVESSSGHILKAHGRMLKYKGWLEIMEDTEEDDKDAKLPLLKTNEKLTLKPPVKAEQKFTQPPPRFSEKTLVKELEKRGIGRPSTYAAIFSKITDRDYVKVKSNIFYPTDLGKSVIDSIVKYFSFINYDYTAEMELELDKIADGKFSYLEMMNKFYKTFAVEVKTAYFSNRKDYGFKCEKCQSQMILKNGKNGHFMACSTYPACNFSFSVKMENDLPVRIEREINVEKNIKCPECKAGMIRRVGQYGPFYACSRFPNCNGKAPVIVKDCPKCDSHLALRVKDETLMAVCQKFSCGFSEKAPKDDYDSFIKYSKKALAATNNIPKEAKKVVKDGERFSKK